MSTERILLVRNDTGPQLGLTITDDNGDAQDISGATVTIRVRQLGGSGVLVSRNAAVDPALGAAEGRCIVAWAEGDLDLPEDDYEAEVQVVYPSGVRQTTYETYRLRIRERFD